MVAEAQRAFYVMFGVISALWLLQLVNWLDNGGLVYQFGILPRNPARLPDVLSAPLLHLSWQHLESNSGPLFVFGFLAAYRGVRKFLWLTLLVVLTSGLVVWAVERDHVVTVGASGVIFGYFGYVVLRGLFDRNLIDSLVGVVMFASFAYILMGALPGAPGVSWLGHLGGLVGGLLGAWIFRDRGGPMAIAKPTPVDVASPRAALHQELDDLGL